MSEKCHQKAACFIFILLKKQIKRQIFHLHASSKIMTPVESPQFRAIRQSPQSEIDIIFIHE